MIISENSIRKFSLVLVLKFSYVALHFLRKFLSAVQSRSMMYKPRIPQSLPPFLSIKRSREASGTISKSSQ